VFAVGGNLAIGAGGRFDAVGMGFNAYGGPGATGDRAGGAHGGQGADSGNGNGGGLVTYGSITNPISLGSGVAGYGTSKGAARSGFPFQGASPTTD